MGAAWERLGMCELALSLLSVPLIPDKACTVPLKESYRKLLKPVFVWRIFTPSQTGDQRTDQVIETNIEVRRFCVWLTINRSQKYVSHFRWPCCLSRRSAARFLAGVAGSNSSGDMDVCGLWVLCFVKGTLRRADLSSRGFIQGVVCLGVITYSA
jgi:hypothetical protein